MKTRIATRTSDARNVLPIRALSRIQTDTQVARAGTAELVKGAIADGLAVVASQIELAFIDLEERLVRGAKSAVIAALALVVATATIGFLSAGLAFALSDHFSAWIACMIVGGILLGATIGTMYGARFAYKMEGMQPLFALSRIREDREWNPEKTN
jgi:uncharacterized membrane protein YqjE